LLLLPFSNGPRGTKVQIQRTMGAGNQDIWTKDSSAVEVESTTLVLAW
jgi:hypothetical protein